MAAAKEITPSQETVTTPTLSRLKDTTAACLIGTGRLMSATPLSTPSRRDGRLGAGSCSVGGT